MPGESLEAYVNRTNERDAINQAKEIAGLYETVKRSKEMLAVMRKENKELKAKIDELTVANHELNAASVNPCVRCGKNYGQLEDWLLSARQRNEELSRVLGRDRDRLDYLDLYGDRVHVRRNREDIEYVVVTGTRGERGDDKSVRAAIDNARLDRAKIDAGLAREDKKP